MREVKGETREARAARRAPIKLPRGVTRAEAHVAIARAMVRYGADAAAIAREVGFSKIVVDHLLDERSGK